MFTNTKFIVVVLLMAVCFASVAHTQVLFFGPCSRNVSVQSNFNVSRYLGVWYENSKYPAVFEIGGKCNVANYTLRPDGDVNVLNTMVNVNTGASQDIEGSARVVSNAKLQVTFPVLQSVINVKVASNYWVLSTDYDSYSVVYSCTPVGRFNLEHAVIVWVLTRERQANSTIVDQAKSVLTANGLTTDFLIKTEQIGCGVQGIVPVM